MTRVIIGLLLAAGLGVGPTTDAEAQERSMRRGETDRPAMGERQDRRENRRDRRDDDDERPDRARDRDDERRRPRTEDEPSTRRAPQSAEARNRRNARTDRERGDHVQRIRERQSARAQRPVVNGHSVRANSGNSVVTIRGERFDSSTEVYIGDTKVSGVSVTPRALTFTAPAAASGVLTVRHGGQALVVGRYTRARDQRARPAAAEVRTRAQSRWQQRRAQLAADEAARRAALEAREAELAASRAERRRTRLANLRAEYEQRFLAQTAVQDELALHAARLARIERMKRVVDVKYEDELAVRIEVLAEREDERHEARMNDLRAAFQGS